MGGGPPHMGGPPPIGGSFGPHGGPGGPGPGGPGGGPGPNNAHYSRPPKREIPAGPPVTVFVGNITEKAPDAMIRY